MRILTFFPRKFFLLTLLCVSVVSLCQAAQNSCETLLSESFDSKSQVVSPDHFKKEIAKISLTAKDSVNFLRALHSPPFVVAMTQSYENIFGEWLVLPVEAYEGKHRRIENFFGAPLKRNDLDLSDPRNIEKMSRALNSKLKDLDKDQLQELSLGAVTMLNSYFLGPNFGVEKRNDLQALGIDTEQSISILTVLESFGTEKELLASALAHLAREDIFNPHMGRALSEVLTGKPSLKNSVLGPLIFSPLGYGLSFVSSMMASFAVGEGSWVHQNLWEITGVIGASMHLAMIYNFHRMELSDQSRRVRSTNAAIEALNAVDSRFSFPALPNRDDNFKKRLTQPSERKLLPWYRGQLEVTKKFDPKDSLKFLELLDRYLDQAEADIAKYKNEENHEEKALSLISSWNQIKLTIAKISSIQGDLLMMASDCKTACRPDISLNPEKIDLLKERLESLGDFEIVFRSNLKRLYSVFSGFLSEFKDLKVSKALNPRMKEILEVESSFIEQQLLIFEGAAHTDFIKEMVLSLKAFVAQKEIENAESVEE